MNRELNAEKALIFRIIHRQNMPWVLDNGLHCKNSKTLDPRYVSIGNPELIDKRSHRAVDCAPGGTLGDYVPFYFTPFSPMLYNIKTGYNGIRKRENAEILVLVSSLYRLIELNIPFLFTDRHALLVAAQFFNNVSQLDKIDWAILQARDFKRDADDLSKVERYQAEALVHRHLPVEALLGVGCYDGAIAAELNEHLAKRKVAMQVAIRPGWYF